MEGSGYYANLQVDPTAGPFQNKYYSTTSFQSHVPLTYYSLPKNDTDDLRSYPPVDFDTGIKGASFLARNCGSINHREDLVRDLIEAAEAASLHNNKTPNSTFRIDSLSSCLHHAPYGFPNGTNPQSPKRDILQKYLFHLAFENQNTNDYVTEKLWETLKAGTIPVYWGASNVRDHLPHPHSVIVVADFLIHQNDNTARGRHNVDVAALVDYLIKVANNRTLYDSHHAWRRTKASISGPMNDAKDDDTSTTNQIFYQRFLDKYEFTKTDFKCRICRFAYSLQHGWGFDHNAQKVQHLQFSPYDSEHKKMLEKTNKIGFNRSTCFKTDTHRMVYPLREEWDHESSNTMGKQQQHHKNDDYFCSQKDGVLYSRVFKTPSHKFLRTIWDHDGVTDMEIRRILQQPQPPAVHPTSVVLRLVTSFSTTSTATLVVDSHVSYHAETSWRNPDWQRYATASNKRARKRILPAAADDTTHSNSLEQGKMTLLWIQNEQSRIVLMVDAPPRDVLPNEYIDSGKNFTGNLLVSLPAPGTIELCWPWKASTLRVRWIVEDMYQYKGNNSTTKTLLQNKESYFSSFLVDEFSHPLIVEPIDERHATVLENDNAGAK